MKKNITLLSILFTTIVSAQNYYGGDAYHPENTIMKNMYKDMQNRSNSSYSSTTPKYSAAATMKWVEMDKSVFTGPSESQLKAKAAYDQMMANEAAFGKKLENFYKQTADKKLDMVSRNYDKLISTALSNGISDAQAKMMYGYSAQDFKEKQKRNAIVNFMNSKPECSGDCKERYNYGSGDSYYEGNTKYGVPHGFGTTYYSNGTTMTGEYAGGKAFGMITQKSANFSGTGEFENNIPVGLHTYTFNDGSVEKINFDTGEKETIYKDGFIRKGQFDSKTGEIVKGYIKYRNGNEFSGTFTNGDPDVGIFKDKTRTFYGKFSDSPENLSLKYGMLITNATGNMVIGYFTKKMQREKFTYDWNADGSSQGTVYSAPDVPLYHMTTFASGNIMLAKQIEKGLLLGTFFDKEKNANYAISYTNQMNFLKADDPNYKAAAAYGVEAQKEVLEAYKQFVPVYRNLGDFMPKIN